MNQYSTHLATQVATLIANPAAPALTCEIADLACQAVGADKPDWLARGIACDISIGPDNNLSPDSAIDVLRRTIGGHQIDVTVQAPQSRRKKALIADMDSTIIQQECIDELAAMAGIKDQVAQITARAMNGEIEFEAALRQRMDLLKGLNIKVIDEVLDQRITLTPGGRELVSTMKGHGAWCALVSGGFTGFTRQIAHLLGFDENHGNILLEENGVLTGKVAEPILGQQAKVDALKRIAAEKSLVADDFIAVGDGANDLGMLDLAGIGVALHAKPTVAEQAEYRIDHGDLTALLYIQGYRQDDFSS